MSSEIPQIATSVDDDNSSSSPGRASSPADVHDLFCFSTLIPTNFRNSPDFLGFPASYTSDAPSHRPSSPTLSVHSTGSIFRTTSAVLLDNSPEEQDGLSSSNFIAPSTQIHFPKSCTITVSSIGTNLDVQVDDNRPSSLGLGPVHPCHSGSDVPIMPTTPTNLHVDAGPDTSRPSSVASFFRKIVRVRKHGNSDINPDSAELARLAILGDPKQEAYLNVEPFAFKPLQLVNLVSSKSLENLGSLGGVEGLLHGLGTNRLRGLGKRGSPDPAIINPVTPYGVEMTPITLRAGVSEGLQGAASPSVGHFASIKFSTTQDATIEDRQRIYGQNIFPQRPSKPLLFMMWSALHNKVLVLLSIPAVASLTLGVFLNFSSIRPEGDPSVDWAEGVAIIVVILIVVIVGSLNDWEKERQFRALDEKKEDRLIKVIRDGGEQQIHTHEVVVGDVVLLEPGDIIPCDGIFLSGHNVWCDESSATGNSDAIEKIPYEECISLRDKRLTELDGPSSDGELLGRADCFIVSGSKVLEGVGTYVAICVGSLNSRIMIAFPHGSENTLWRFKLNNLADAITKIGGIGGGLIFVALLIRYFLEAGTNNFQRTPSELGMTFANIINIAVALVVVALPEGLPLAMTLAFSFARKQMSRENLLVHVLGSCESMANVSVICADKTGTLTQNEMTVVAGTIGVHAKFMRRLEENGKWAGNDDGSSPNTKDLIDLANINAVLPHPVKDLLNAVIATNSSAFEGVDPKSGAPVFIGSKIESALLGFAKELGWPNYKDTRNSVDIVQMIPFSSYRKFMSCVVRLPDGSHRLYVKGASEILAQNCTRHVVLPNSAPSANEVETAPIGALEQHIISTTIASYASKALRTIALCYRDFPSWPPKGARLLDEDEVDYYDLTTDLTLISIIGIEDPLRLGVREAVANCGKAGVRVKMCTGDNVLTAKSIAQQCGIYTPGGIVMEGPHFRTLSPDVMTTIVPRLQVLARSSPEDKRILVEKLRELGDVVGVTGSGTYDVPALETVLSVGITRTEVVKEASNIVLMKDNFSSIVKAIMWGRYIDDSVRKFLQFQISAKVSAVVITFVWVLVSSSDELPLSTVQLLWVNLIMDAFAALALATDWASSVQLYRKPDKKTDPLFTINMIKQILGQAVYQITVILIFHFLGPQILGFHHTHDSTLQEHHHKIVRTLIFNAFVFAQIFNSFNCRRLDTKLNVFEGVTKNWYFMAVTAIEAAVQVLICLVGGSAFDVTRIGAREWAISLALGFVSLPLGALIRFIPSEPCERPFTKLQLLPTYELLPTTRPDAELGSSFATDHVCDNLVTLRRRRRCRDSMRRKSFVGQRRAFPHPDGGNSLLAMVPYHGASHTTASDWQWRARGSHSDPRFDPSTSSATLWENMFEVHPDTPPDDPVYELLGVTPQRPAMPATCAS